MRELALGRIQEKRSFKINLVIFLSVKALLLVLWGALNVAGLHSYGQLWPYPVVMGAWAVFLAFQGYTAYRGHQDA
jgi:2TM domain